MSDFHELCSRSHHGIFAVTYRNGHPMKPSRVIDGSIVETALPQQRREAPDFLPACFEVGHGGFPATIHHANLGLVVAQLGLTGVFLLPDGEVAAIYGAEATGLKPEPLAVR